MSPLIRLHLILDRIDGNLLRLMNYCDDFDNNEIAYLMPYIDIIDALVFRSVNCCKYLKNEENLSDNGSQFGSEKVTENSGY